MTTKQIRFTRPALALCALAIANPSWAVSVSLTSPTSSVVAGPATITVAATATPGAGKRILRVDFFKGTTRIGTDTNAPYGLVMSNVPIGTYVFTALAVDSGGSVGISEPVIVRVDNPPSVVLTTPTDNSTFAPGTDIPVAASASDSDEVVRKVEFFAGDTLIGTQVLAPYQIIWRGVPPGRHRLTARATDLAGLGTTSVPLTITVGSAPTVNITTPSSGAVVKGGTITVTAQASDSDGAVAKVEFFDGGSLVSTATASPGGSTYSATLGNLAVGSHTLTARASDDRGLSSTSSPVQVTVISAVGQMYFIHTDHLNTPRLISSQTGTTVWRWDQAEPFGNSVPNSDADGDGIAFDFPLRFPGQYADRETGLNYNYFRDYDPGTGVYKQGDPVGLAGGLNTYLYVDDNPIRIVDPVGLMGFGGGGSATTAGAAPRPGPVSVPIAAPSCNGKWRYYTQKIIYAPWVPGNCECYWLCEDCDRPIMWSGDINDLPRTRGSAFVDFNSMSNPGGMGRPTGPTESDPPRAGDPGLGKVRPGRIGNAGDLGKGNRCICPKPGPETGCDACPSQE